MPFLLCAVDVLPNPPESSSRTLWVGLVALLVGGLVAIWILRRRAQRDARDERK